MDTIQTNKERLKIDASVVVVIGMEVGIGVFVMMTMTMVLMVVLMVLFPRVEQPVDHMDSAIQADDVRYDCGAATIYEYLSADYGRLLVARNSGE